MTITLSRRFAPRRALAGSGASLLVALALALAPIPAAAQTTGGGAQGQGEAPVATSPDAPTAVLGEKFQDWQIVCQTSGEQELCAAVQEVFSGEKRLALWAAFGYLQQDQEGPVMLLRVPYDLVDPPTGFRVGLGTQVAVDGSDNVKVPVDLCGPGGCQVGLAMTEELLGSLKNGNKLNVTVALASGQTATINASLKGFTAAYDHLTKTRKPQ